KKHAASRPERMPYSLRVKQRLELAGYRVYSDVIDLSQFGVPQSRNRFILIAIKERDPALRKLGDGSPIELLRAFRKRFLGYKRLPSGAAISVRDAIGDLETKGSKLVPCLDSPYKSYVQVN